MRFKPLIPTLAAASLVLASSLPVGAQGTSTGTNTSGNASCTAASPGGGSTSSTTGSTTSTSTGATSGTSSAGKQWGAMHIPRIGQEVIVDFLEGDPDQPLIVGSVFNADHMPPNDLPKSKATSGIMSNSYPKGGGYNGVMLDDNNRVAQLPKILQDMHKPCCVPAMQAN